MAVTTELAFAFSVADSADARSAAPFTFSVSALTFPKVVVQFPLACESDEPKASQLVWVPVRRGLDFCDEYIILFVDNLIRIWRLR